MATYKELKARAEELFRSAIIRTKAVALGKKRPAAFLKSNLIKQQRLRNGPCYRGTLVVHRATGYSF